MPSVSYAFRSTHNTQSPRIYRKIKLVISLLGKSSTGNSLLRSRNAFYATQSAESITTDCKSGEYQYTDKHGQPQKLIVVDTPGFFDTNEKITNAMVERKIASQIFEMTTPGVHAFFIVLRVDRFTPEEKSTIDFIRRIFGPDAAKYCILVFTGEDQLEEGQTLNDFIKSSSDLNRLAQDCGQRIFAINNKLNGERLDRKINQLIAIVDTMIRSNNGQFYTNAEYQRIERSREEEKRKLDEKERQKKEAERKDIEDRARKDEREKLEKEKLEKEMKKEDSSGSFQSALKDTVGSVLSQYIIPKLLEAGGSSVPPANYGMGMPYGQMGSTRPHVNASSEGICVATPGMNMPYGQMSSTRPHMNASSEGICFATPGMNMPYGRMSFPHTGRGIAHGVRFAGAEHLAPSDTGYHEPAYEGSYRGQHHSTRGGH
ncbi:unnamed protein product [Adineta ricciae]|nr:unnamed protein product [Adineta ricciae]